MLYNGAVKLRDTRKLSRRSVKSVASRTIDCVSAALIYGHVHLGTGDCRNL